MRTFPRMTGLLCLCLLVPAAGAADDTDTKYPLGPQLRVLAHDVTSPDYRKLVTEKMLVTDLAAEWQRVATEDNPESFLEKHGGKEKVLANPELKRAYERRVAIRDAFLDLMREGYKRYKQVPPFDRGAKPEAPGTVRKAPVEGGAALAVVPPAPGAEAHWPRFRGPSGQGWTTARSLPLRWSKDGENILWRTRIPGRGNSSPVVWGERVFLTSATEQGKERMLHCLDLADGRLLWSRTAPARSPEPSVRDKNGYASATPVTDGERVIAFLGACGLLCYDIAGNLQWHYDAFRFKTTHGTGSSPLLYKDKVIFIHDQNQDDSIFVALDKKTGKLLWSHPRPRAMTWSTPIVVRVGDHDELIFSGGETVKGYDPDTGKELWTLAGPTQEVVPTIVVGKTMLYGASGRNGPIIAFRPGGAGDVTQTHTVWRAVRVGPHVPSPILVGDRLYTVNDMGIVSCLDALTGKLLWQERIPHQFSASPVEAGGVLYFPSERGVTFVLQAGDAFRVVARNDLGSPLLASPAVVGNRMLLRTEDELVCVGAKP